VQPRGLRMSDDPTLSVAINLREIARLADMLEDQAYHHANAKDFPGGDALAAMAPVANLEAWQNKLDTAERLWLDGQGPEPFSDDSDEWEPPLQLLLFWTELWRMDLDTETEHPTLDTETGWIIDNLPTLHLLYRDQRWDLFEQDVAKARRSLENTLRDGERQQSGAPCVNCRRNLLRLTDPKTGGLTDDWRCPGCQREYNPEQYRNAVAAGYASLQVENIDDQGTWATVQRAANEVKRSPRTVKSWIGEGIVRRACLLLGRRDVVSLDDVQREADTRKRRNRDVA
jgi:hypothetical protein